MPRRSPQHYLAARRTLREVWLTERNAFGRLSPQDQAHLHDYYQPSVERTDRKALQYRLAITVAHPSLVQCAGRAVKHFMHPTYHPVDVTGKKGRRITVRGLRRPEPDMHKLARALLETAKRMLAEQEAARSEDVPPRSGKLA